MTFLLLVRGFRGSGSAKTFAIGAARDRRAAEIARFAAAEDTAVFGEAAERNKRTKAAEASETGSSDLAKNATETAEPATNDEAGEQGENGSRILPFPFKKYIDQTGKVY